MKNNIANTFIWFFKTSTQLFAGIYIFTANINLYAYELTPPTSPTVDSCRHFSNALYSKIAEILREESACMSKPGAFLGIDSEPNDDCSSGPPARLRRVVTGYPHCFSREAERCELEGMRSEIKLCFDRAKEASSSNDRARKIIEIDKKLNKANSLFDELKNKTYNPKNVFWDVVEPRLNETTKIRIGLLAESTIKSKTFGNNASLSFNPRSNSLIELKMFDRNKNFTNKGETVLQETYDFVYGKTIGNKSALGTQNPIIQQIQGTAASEIRRVHSGIISEIQLFSGKVSSVINSDFPSSLSRPPPSTERTRSRNSQHSECLILATKRASILAIDDPDKFEKLTEFCR